jgi:hypothetical protein
MNANYKSLVQKLDLGGMEAREQRREQIKKEEAAQKPQQLDAAAAVRRGLHSYLNESYRQIDLEKLRRDPATAYFLLANSRHDLT